MSCRVPDFVLVKWFVIVLKRSVECCDKLIELGSYNVEVSNLSFLSVESNSIDFTVMNYS